jgi:hypothetical protein
VTVYVVFPFVSFTVLSVFQELPDFTWSFADLGLYVVYPQWSRL